MKNKILLLIALTFCISCIFGQVVLLDKIVETESYKLFPSASNENEYYYLSDNVRLGRHEDGSLQASFMRYTSETESSDEGDGGGLFHALVELYADAVSLQEAEREIKRDNPNAILMGPIAYESGTISLISSFQVDNGDLVERIIGMGNAPLLTGHKASFSIQLTKEGAQILERSLQTNTPDLSVKFEMVVKGYNSPKRVKIAANWEQVYQHETIELAAVTPTFSTDISAAFEDLEKSGAIKVEQFGEDAELEKAKDAAYSKLLSMIFEPSNGSGVPTLDQLTKIGSDKKSMIDRATDMLSSARKEARADFDKYENNSLINFIEPKKGRDEAKYAAVNDFLMDYYKEENKALIEKNIEGDTKKPDLPSLAIASSYHLKQSRRSGDFTIDLNKFTEGTRSHRFDFNVGPNIKDCNECMVQTFLDKFMHQQRLISVTLNGIQADDFEDHINFITVEILKEHQSGEKSIDEIGVDVKKFNEQGNRYEVKYGWKNDEDLELWKKYKFRSSWNFHGGENIKTAWTENESASIPLSPPLTKRAISIEGNKQFFEDNNIRAVVLRISNDHTPLKEVRIKLSNELVVEQVDMVSADLNEHYEYEVFWYFKDGKTKSSNKIKSNLPFIVLDQASLLE